MQQPIQSSPIDTATPQGVTVSTGRRSKARFQILALLAVGTMINYLDRTVLGIAAPQLTKELGINAALMGLLFSVFSWSYVAAQIPGGLFLDRFGSKVTYFLSMTFWSLCTLAQGLMHGIGALFAFLMLHVSVGVYFLLKRRERTFGMHLVVPLIGFVIIGYVLLNADTHAKIGGLIWLAIGVVVIVVRKLTGRSVTLTMDENARA